MRRVVGPFAVFALAAAVRLFYLFGIEAYPKFELIRNRLDDQVVFDLWAKTILSGRAFDYAASGHEFATWASLKPGVYPQGPIYPWFLTAFYRVFGFEYDGFRMLQMLLGSIACALLVVVARRFVREGPAIACGAAMALYGPIVFYESTFLRAGVFHGAAVFALYLLLRASERPSPRAMIFAGVALGVGVLLRANYLLFAAPAIFWLAWTTRTRLAPTRSAAFAAIGLLITISPIALINSVRHGGPTFLSSNGPYILFVGNAHDATGLSAGPSPYYYEVKASAPIEDISLTREIVADVAKHPMNWLGLLGRKTLGFFGPEEIPNNLSFDMARRLNPRLDAAPISFPLIFPFAVLGVAAAWPQRRRFAVLYLFAATYAAGTILFYVLGRLRQPIVPVLLIFAAFAAQQAWDAARERRPALPTAAAAALLFGVLLVPGPNFRSTDFGMAGAAYETLGTQQESDLRLREAAQAYARAAALNPANENAVAGVLRILGPAPADDPETTRLCEQARAAAEAGRTDEAIESLTATMRRFPKAATPRQYLANVYYLSGDPEQALRFLEEAVELEPQNSTLRRSLIALRRELQTES